jgi:hypothetical protein
VARRKEHKSSRTESRTQNTAKDIKAVDCKQQTVDSEKKKHKAVIASEAKQSRTQFQSALEMENELNARSYSIMSRNWINAVSAQYIINIL